MISSAKTLKTLLLAASLATMLVAVVPSVEAHTCEAENPGTSCGDCNSGLLGHSHKYTDGTVYCSSGPSLPLDKVTGGIVLP